jgi:hypothetical protein
VRSNAWIWDFSEPKHHRVIRRIHVKPNDIPKLRGEPLVVRQFKLAHPVWLKTMVAPNTMNRRNTDADHFRHGEAVDWVVSPGGGFNVAATILCALSSSSRASRPGRVFSSKCPSTPSSINRSCQRQTQILLMPVCRLSLQSIDEEQTLRYKLKPEADRAFEIIGLAAKK